MDFSGAKTISGIAGSHQGSSVRAWAASPPRLAVLPGGHLVGWPCRRKGTHPSLGATCRVLLSVHRETGPEEPKPPRGLRPRRPGQMAALDLLSHPATLGGPGPRCSSGKPSHDGTKANGDSGAQGRATALAQHQPHRVHQGRMLLLPPAPIPPPAHYI